MADQRIEPVPGWLLLSRDEIDGERTGHWYISWLEPFPTEKSALAFAKNNRWPKPYRAVRGRLAVDS